MSLEQLQQSIDGAALAIDGRLARDAETIRQLVAACRQARGALAEAENIRGVGSIIADIDSAIARAEGK